MISPSKTFLLVYCVLGLTSSVFNPTFGYAAESHRVFSRVQLRDYLLALLNSTQESLRLALTDCTFAFFSSELASTIRLNSKKLIADLLLDNSGHCSLPGFDGVDIPYEARTTKLEPLRIDLPSKQSIRREFLVVDRSRLVVILSDDRLSIPQELTVYDGTFTNNDDASTLIAKLDSLLWPSERAPLGMGVTREEKWSTANHRLITKDILHSLGFTPMAIAIVEEGNVYVDRVTNQFNNPQHSMRNLWQTVEEAQLVATEWIDSRKTSALSYIESDKHCCALFAMGEALHTIQDRKHKWIPLYRHLLLEILSDFFPGHAEEDWELAHVQSRDWCNHFISEVGRLYGEETLLALKTVTIVQCTCEDRY